MEDLRKQKKLNPEDAIKTSEMEEEKIIDQRVKSLANEIFNFLDIREIQKL